MPTKLTSIYQKKNKLKRSCLRNEYRERNSMSGRGFGEISQKLSEDVMT